MAVLLIALVIVVDLLAVLALVYVVDRWARGWLLGALAGLVMELPRIGLAFLLTQIIEVNPGAVGAFFINFRLFNIPILIGIGLLAGGGSTAQAPAANVEGQGGSDGSS